MQELGVDRVLRAPSISLYIGLLTSKHFMAGAYMDQKDFHHHLVQS